MATLKGALGSNEGAYKEHMTQGESVAYGVMRA